MTFLILPDRHRPVGQVLLPMRRADWVQASQRPCFDPDQEAARQRWRLTARLDDGHSLWQGWFDDREDVDAFLWAITTGALAQEPALWRLPSPAYHPDLVPDHAVWQMQSVVLYTTTTAVPVTIPADFVAVGSRGVCIGGGGGGASQFGGGGAGGGCAYQDSLALTPGQSVRVYVGAGGTAGATGLNNGNEGSASHIWVNYPSGNPLIQAPGGPGGITDTGAGGAAPPTTDSIFFGSVKRRGGNVQSGSSSVPRGGGGGGAAGPDSDGANNGGAGGGPGGGAAPGAGNHGNPGTTWGDGFGPGSGGGSVSSGSGRNGGFRGGGGGGGIGAGGAGRIGLIALLYTPKRAPGFNMPMLGW